MRTSPDQMNTTASERLATKLITQRKYSGDGRSKKEWGAVLLLDQMMQLCQSHLAAFAWASALPKGRW